MTTRRDFLGRLAMGGAALPFLPELALPADPSPMERVRIGFIGVGGQGRGNLRGLLNHAVAVCDVDSKRLGEAKDAVEKSVKGGKRPCAAYSDYRKLLEDKNIDAVVITTPDHWHAMATVDACAAGKHVYCEKPLTLTVAEGRAMVLAARKYKRVVQTGSQQRSDSRFRQACELVRNGKIGRVKSIRVGIANVNFKGPGVADGEAPKELDYNFWLGPAPQRPYNVKRVHYNFRFFWDYSGGQLTNWGAHHLDIAQWGLGMDESGPVSVEGKARFNANKWYEVPEWCQLEYTYANGVKMTCEMGARGGTLFEGEKGSVFVTRGRIEANPPELLKEQLGDKAIRLIVSANHFTNWLDCIKSGRTPICDVEIGHRSSTVCHLGNIALRTGRKITFDPVKETISGDAAAAAMLSRPYRAPWKLPG